LIATEFQMQTEDPIQNVKKATAILITCLVDAMTETDPNFKDRFLANLGHSYGKIRNDTHDLNALELLNWTRSMITGFDHTEGQQQPFLNR
jgi:hypothetical protein